MILIKENYLKKKDSFILIYTIIVIIFLVLIGLLFKYYEFDKVFKYNIQIVKKEEFFAKIFIPLNAISNIQDATLVIDDKKINYSIESISDKYFLDDSTMYYEILLNTNLDKKYLIENNIINVKLIKGKTTIYQEIKKMMKGWLYET